MANTIQVNVIADVAKMRSGLKSVENDLGKLGTASSKAGAFLGKSLKTAALGIAGAGIAVGKFGYDAIQSAGDLNETISKTETIFGKAGPAIVKWGENAAGSLGMSQNEALTAVSSFGNLYDQLGFTSGQAAKMGKSFVGVAADLASFHNAAPTEVLDAMLSATRGEYDALQKYIPTINAAAVEQKAMAMTGKDVASSLTDQDKALALNQLVLEGQGKAQGDFARTSDSLANQQRILTAEFENVKAKIGTALMPVMEQLIGAARDHLVPVLEKFANWMKTDGPAAIDAVVVKFQQFLDAVKPVAQFVIDHWQGLLKLVAVFYAVVAVLAAVNFAVAAYHTVMTVARGVMIVFRNAQLALNLAMMMNPIGLVIAAIVALIAIIVIAWKNSETFRNIVIGAWNAVKAATGAVWNWIKDLLGKTWDWLKSTGEKIFTGVRDFIIAVWNKVKDVTNTVWTAIKNFVRATWDWIKDKVTTVFNFYRDLITTVWKKIEDVTTSVWTAIREFLNRLWENIQTKATNLFNAVKDFLGRTWDNIQTKIENIWNAIKTFLSNAWDRIRETATNAVTAIRERVAAAFTAIQNKAGDVWNWIKNKTTEIWNAIKTTVSNAVGKVVDFVRDLKDRIVAVFTGAKDILVRAGKAIVEGLWDGIQSLGGWIKDKVMSFVKSILPDAAEKALGIRSPSRVFRRIGQYTVLGLAKGLDENRRLAVRASQRLANAVQRGFDAEISLDSLTGRVSAANHGSGSRVEITVVAPVGSSPADIGRELQTYLDTYLTSGGRRLAS